MSLVALQRVNTLEANFRTGGNIVKGILFPENRIGFLSQIDDLRLKYCIPKENLGDNVTGRKIAWERPEISPKGGHDSKIFLIDAARTDDFN